jgi:hypothetical protein
MKHFLLSRQLLIACCLWNSLLFSATAFSQVSRQWVRFYDDRPITQNSANSIVADELGNVYVTGSGFQLSSTNGWVGDYVTIKYNPSGTEEWVVRYDGSNGMDQSLAIAMDKSGNIYVTGYSEGNGTKTDIATIKYNRAGVQQWVARFNGPGNDKDQAYSIKTDQYDNVYVVGYSVTTSSSTPDYVTIKYNSSGVQQWVRYHNGTSNGADLAFAMVVDTATSDVYITGSTAFDYSGASGEDYTTVKYNSAGDLQWVRDYKGPGQTQDEGKVIAIDRQGNVFVSGFSVAFGSDTFGCVTIKYDPLGNVKWIAHYSGPSHVMAQPSAIVADNFGNIYITGFAINDANGVDCLTIKYDSAGIQQWVQLYNNMPNGRDDGNAIALDDDGNVYVVGISADPNTYNDYVTIKYSPEGMLLWAERYDAFTKDDGAAAVVVNKFHDVFVTGFVHKYIDAAHTNSYFGTIKYTQPRTLVVTTTPDTTVFYGYGSNCVQLKAEVAGGMPPYTFNWLPYGNTPNSPFTTVCPATTTAYRVIAKDALGTTDTTQVTVKVIDVRCGNQNDKVVVCHDGKELCIAPQAVQAHLQHGDKLGSCSVTVDACDKIKDVFKERGKIPFIFKAYPNPFGHVSTLVYQLPLDAQVSITVMDLSGREITTLVREKKRAGCYLAFIDGRRLVPGTYVCKMVISLPGCQFVQTLKLMVAK